ncbi:MAG: complexed with cef1p [Paramarteilia canceri]
MTTAARPTFDSARRDSRGFSQQLGSQSRIVCARDLPSETTLKYREDSESKKTKLDFLRELNENEENGKTKLLTVERADEDAKIFDVSSEEDISNEEIEESDEDSEEEGLLMAELAKIRRERADAAEKADQEMEVQRERVRKENILHGNPLLEDSVSADGGDFQVKRAWNEEVVFMNCAKNESKADKKMFINDPLRSDFHKRFMSKYVK